MRSHACEGLQRITVASTEKRQVCAVIAGLRAKLLHIELARHLLGPLIHALGLVESVQTAEGISKILVNQRRRSPVACGLEHIEGLFVVVAGGLVLVKALVEIRDVGTEPCVAFGIPAGLKPVLCGLPCA